MQGIMETIFDIVYLTTVILAGFIMFTRNKNNRQYHLFGIMAIILGFGDAFHLIPRSYALLTNGLEANAAVLGIGKLITSITMTVFYVILYYIWRQRYNIKGKNKLTIAVYGLAIIRIILCLFPQNEWFKYNANLSWGIYRNIPFGMLGILIIYLFFKEAKNDSQFKFMWLAIVLSFTFYIPVVLWSHIMPIVGVLMIPKTIAYVWIVFMGFKEFINKKKE
ncbi:hypothetical protein SAMN05216497_10230 [Clostridium cochlearium]|uniref:Hydrolase n=1 Tax=Clostridium cochlearium TaxID=1494 RepID=A0ABY0QIL4_CLOCO|nr:hypothetical protein [Clostridium cochlearium]SDK89154.1 hypothetical protein SAMN05216497_10230 [Clostridium cochlearium]